MASLRIICLLDGDDETFKVSIPEDADFDDLKPAVKVLKQNTLRGVDASNLRLFQFFDKVPLQPSENFYHRLKSTRFMKVQDPYQKVATFYRGQPSMDFVHVLIRLPPDDARAVDTLPDLEKRQKCLARIPKKPPSAQARPNSLTDLQNMFPPAFRYNRPPEAGPLIPITLVHPEFNEFIRDCSMHELTPEDHTFALDLSATMSRLYTSEKQRQEAFLGVCQKNGVEFTPSKIKGTLYTTEGDIRTNNCLNSIAELTWESGAAGAEPVFQAGLYFTSFMRQNPELLEVDCPFPCLGLYVIGSMLGFIGLAFTTDNIHIQPLGPALRLDYHPSDMNLRRMTARYLGAFKCSIARLKNYYENDFPKLPPLGPQSRSNSSYPCYFEYKPLTSPPTETSHMTPAKKSEITYTSQPHDDKLVYYGQVEDKSVCIKFTTSYSKDAHVFCASLNFAPKLLGFEELAGGWYMIIMERIDELYIALDDALTAGIPLCDGLQNLILSAQTALQQGNFVHGDLRAANLMVKKDGTKGFMILDFDWAGRPENVRYPMNLNAEVWRPEGAVDEALITKDHDDKMIQHVLESLPGFKAGSV